jgi:hypothetical protein
LLSKAAKNRFRKKIKKPVDKRNALWYYKQAVAESDRNKHSEP